MRIRYVRDPDGNLVELSTAVEPSGLTAGGVPLSPLEV
jgi:hypothetical protein